MGHVLKSRVITERLHISDSAWGMPLTERRSTSNRNHDQLPGICNLVNQYQPYENLAFYRNLLFLWNWQWQASFLHFVAQHKDKANFTIYNFSYSKRVLQALTSQKGKDVPAHTTKTHWGIRWIDPLNLNLDTIWRWMVNFTHRPHYPPGNKPRYPLNKRLDGPNSRSAISRGERHLFILPGFET